MVNSYSSISPQLEQALSTVVDKRQHQNALKALELSEGARQEAEATVQRQRGQVAYLSAQKTKLEKENEILKCRLRKISAEYPEDVLVSLLASD